MTVPRAWGSSGEQMHPEMFFCALPLEPLSVGLVWVAEGWDSDSEFSHPAGTQGSDAPGAHGILCARGFCPLLRAAGCIWESHTCLWLTCKVELDLESSHRVAEKDFLADWEHSLRGATSTHQGWVLLTSPLSSHEVLEGKAQWKTKCHIINLYFGEIFLSTEQTSQVTHPFNGVYYFIIAGCYNGQLKHDKQKQQKCDVVDDQISFPYICFVNLHSSPLCFLWWAVIKAWNSCLPTLPSHVNSALGMSLLQTAFLIMVPEHHAWGGAHKENVWIVREDVIKVIL